jgi:hypothetical protein
VALFVKCSVHISELLTETPSEASVVITWNFMKTEKSNSVGSISKMLNVRRRTKIRGGSRKFKSFRRIGEVSILNCYERQQKKEK